MGNITLRGDWIPQNGCFFGKLPNGLDRPPTRPFLEITLRFFPENPLSMRKFAMKFFGLAMTPPPLPPFWKLHCAFLPKIYRFETNKICNVIFWIGNDPPPPFGRFPKKHPFLVRRSSLMQVMETDVPTNRQCNP